MASKENERHVGFLLKEKDFKQLGVSDVKEFFAYFDGELPNKSEIMKRSIVETIQRKRNEEEEEYMALLTFLKVNGISYGEALQKLKEPTKEVENQSIDHSNVQLDQVTKKLSEEMETVIGSQIDKMSAEISTRILGGMFAGLFGGGMDPTKLKDMMGSFELPTKEAVEEEKEEEVVQDVPDMFGDMFGDD